MRQILMAITIALFSISCSKMPVGTNSDGTSLLDAARQAPPVSEAAPRSKDFIERCIADASADKLKLRAMGDLQIYSHAADFDGNGVEDAAVLVTTDAEPQKGGLLICRNGDVKLRSTFGPLFNPAKTLTSFENDNFITSEWEVILGSESSKVALDPDRKSRIGNRNKGDVIAFFHEGGGVFIFWDGNSFRLVEGG